jgi:hypothetical protein
VDAHGDGVGVLLALADDQDVMDPGLLGALDPAHQLVVAEFHLGAHLPGAKFVHEALPVVDLRFCHRQDADLVGRQPEREVAGVMLDQETDEPFVPPERRAV